MDLSIGIAIWFASQASVLSLSDDLPPHPLQSGTHLNAHHESCRLLKNKSEAKILLVGMGSDEQLGGYSKHRAAFQKNGIEGLCAEIERQLKEIPSRNLGRDDRIISDHGREARFPFLDDSLVAHMAALPINVKCDFSLPMGGSRGDKILIRKIAAVLGISPAIAYLPKRAIQFGAKTAKMDDASERGHFSLA
jgi:asparagine synthetase B (glutamine-hydrolysing)